MHTPTLLFNDVILMSFQKDSLSVVGVATVQVETTLTAHGKLYKANIVCRPRHSTPLNLDGVKLI